MKGNILIIGFLTCWGLGATAQIEDAPSLASPNASNLQLYSQIPVDNFTGIPNIDIPMYTFKSRDISVPLTLTYHAAGIKPSDHASWVGLGWSLQAGGVITRIQNDLPDELVDFFAGPGVPRGFFYTYTHLAVSSWASIDSLSNVRGYQYNDFNVPGWAGAHTSPDDGPDEFQFNFLGMSGSLLMGQDGNWHLKSKQGLNFTVQTEIGPYAVWEPNKPNITGSTYPSLIHACLTKFILTAADGTQYFFGTDTATNMDGYTSGSTLSYFSTPDSNSVEFARVGIGYGQEATRTRDGGTVPISWYLTKIKSVSGDSVIFRYTRDGYQVFTNTVALGTYAACTVCQTSFTLGAGDNYTLTDGVTLSTITGIDGTIQFNKSKANILDYTPLGAAGSPMDLAWNGATGAIYTAYANEIFQGDDFVDSAKSTFMELDSMAVSDINGNRVRSFNFSYASGSTQRLFLLSVLEKGGDGTTAMPYTFTYNNMNGLDSVPYNTLKVDHWGYLTNNDPFAGLFPPGGEPSTDNPFSTTTPPGIWAPQVNPSNFVLYVFDNTFNSIYLANRKPVPATMQYGVLTQITYPTGGSTQFTWEPDSYSKFLQVGGGQLSLSVTDMDSTVVGGGLRIRQITSQANFNSPPLTKTYFYVRDYVHGNNVTSGVLNSSLPKYIDSAQLSDTLYYRNWSSNNVSPLRNSGGSPVTYSTVTELNSDGSFKTYTYSNQDNGYLDIPPTNILDEKYITVGTLWAEQNMSSFALERGLLLNEAWYNSGDTILKNIAYQYDSSSSRWNNAVREYNYQRQFSIDGEVLNFDDGGFLTVSTGAPFYYGDLTSPLNIYIEYPYLGSTTETDYDQTGANPLVKKATYTYDTYRNKSTENYTSSQGEPVSKTYNYAGNTISGLSAGAQAGQTAMVNAGMYGIPLETIATRSGVQTGHTRTDYQSISNYNSLIVPANSYQSAYGQPLDSATHYLYYDSKGNIQEYRTRSGIVTCLDWDYNQTYPTVKVLNGYNTVQHAVTTVTSNPYGELSWTSGLLNTQTASFNVAPGGSIKLEGFFSGSPPGGVYYSFLWSLSGPSSQSGTVCAAGGAAGCTGPSSYTLNSMPGGTYTLSVYTESNTGANAYMIYYYTIATIDTTVSGSKDYFYDGFENNTNVNVITGTPHTGNLYWGASTYTTSFVPPDNNTYTIEWWNLASGNWNYNTQTYSQGMNLTGPVDDVRIFPSTAQMSTYTYQPLIGMTSSIDAKGYTSYYTYDGLGRLATVLDKDRNVLKRYCYNYAGQSQSCALNSTPALVAVNGTNSTQENFTVTLTNTGTNTTYNFPMPPGSRLIGEVPAGTYNVFLTPQNENVSAEYIYNADTYIQTYYGVVEYGTLQVNNTLPISISSDPNASINTSNSTSETFNVTFTNTTTNINYNFTMGPGNATIGQVPDGTYNVFLTPQTINESINYLYEAFTYYQTFYGLVEYGGLQLSSSIPINISLAN